MPSNLNFTHVTLDEVQSSQTIQESSELSQIKAKGIQNNDQS